MSAPPRKHLVVLQHGYGGTAVNMLSVARSITASLPDGRFHLLNVQSNEGVSRTKEGIRMCGERLVEDIVSELFARSEDPSSLKYTDLSILGYSAGGLFARYAVGRLEERGILEMLRCASFITLATPHLGCIRPSDGTWRTALWNQGGGVLDKMTKPLRPAWTDGGKTVEEFFLRDAVSSWFESTGDRPALLEVMADPGSSYVRGLRRFTQLLAVANARADRTVPCETAAILPINPYQGVEEESLPSISAHFPHVVKVMGQDEAATLVEGSIRAKSRYFEDFSDAAAMQRMVDGLSTLPWQRVFAWLPGWHTHGSVIARQWMDTPESEAMARSSCGQDVVAFAASALRGPLPAPAS